jgi:hypothetical protein
MERERVDNQGRELGTDERAVMFPAAPAPDLPAEPDDVPDPPEES